MLLVATAFGMFILAAVDLLSLGNGTCGALADQLPVNCWETRLIRGITHWPTNIAAGVEDLTFGILLLVLAVMAGRIND